MKKLTITKARSLIKRELGINAAALTAPEGMNENPEYPWYELHSGSQCIAVHIPDDLGSKYSVRMVALRATRENSLQSTTEYFYGDTMEYADSYTEWKKKMVSCEEMGGDPERDNVILRLRYQMEDDCRKHFHPSGIPSNLPQQEPECPVRNAEKDCIA